MFKEYIGLEFLEIILHGFNPCEFGKGMFLTYKFYSPSFSFLDQKYYTRFCLRKFTNVFYHRFFKINQDCELQLRRKKPSLCECAEELSKLAY